MRTVVGVALVTVCLGLAGCSLFGKKQAARNNNAKPFLGSETKAKTETVSIPRSTDGPLPKANGMIAGLVLAKATGQPVSNAWIRVKDPQEEGESKAAPLDVETTPEGYFTIPGLKVGRYYELIARAKEGDKLIGDIAYVQPPKVSLLFKLGDPGKSARLPPIPDAPSMPNKKAAETAEGSQDRTPAASIGAPIKLRDDPPHANLAAPSPVTGSDAGSAPRSTPDPSNIAKDEFQRIRPQDPTATIPNTPSWPPPVPGDPQWEKVPEERQPRTTPVPPRTPGSVRLPNIPTHVPSCGLYGDKLDNFALYDLNGKVWEYKRDRRGRLTLLDFWYHSCGPCLQAIPHLVDLQKDYGPYGLQVIGIASETGSVEQQREYIRGTRVRYKINYLTLLSGGGPGHCPVMDQFGVEYFPLLVLIDMDGTILWRSQKDGMDRNRHYALKRMIHDRLVTKQSPP